MIPSKMVISIGLNVLFQPPRGKWFPRQKKARSSELRGHKEDFINMARQTPLTNCLHLNSTARTRSLTTRSLAERELITLCSISQWVLSIKLIRLIPARSHTGFLPSQIAISILGWWAPSLTKLQGRRHRLCSHWWTTSSIRRPPNRTWSRPS